MSYYLVAYIFWILYNGIDEGFKNILLSVKNVALIGLIILLVFNFPIILQG